DGHWAGPRTTVAVRTKYIDDALEDALRRGIEQVVILGAGFDARAYRIPRIERTRVFEVDHPATQPRQKAVLSRQLAIRPSPGPPVPIDFTTPRLDRVMPAVGFRRAARPFFICEGVTHCLAAHAVDTLFPYVAGNAASSQIVFTYIHRAMLDGSRSFEG